MILDGLVRDSIHTVQDFVFGDLLVTTLVLCVDIAPLCYHASNNTDRIELRLYIYQQKTWFLGVEKINKIFQVK